MGRIPKAASLVYSLPFKLIIEDLTFDSQLARRLDIRGEQHVKESSSGWWKTRY